METALSTISVLPANRDEQHRFANKLVEEICNGDCDPVKVWQQLTILADTLNEVKESRTVRDVVSKEFAKYGKEGVCVNGSKVTLTTRKTFDYSGCGDATLYGLEAVLQDVKDKIASRKKYLQSLKHGFVAYDEATGAQLNPATYTETEIITVK